MKIFTIGFTKKSAERFFTELKKAGVAKIIDTRLNNISQLSGFAKKNDLAFFAREICGIGYEHDQKFAPTQDMLDEYKKKGGSWSRYEEQFLALMAQREIEKTEKSEVDGACLLCSEEKPHHCHRRLVAEYLRERWDDVQIEHL